MSNAIKGYIFDLDGTLYDFGGVSFSESKLGVEVKKQYFLNIEQYRLGDPNHIYKEICLQCIGLCIFLFGKRKILYNIYLGTKTSWGGSMCFRKEDIVLGQ